MEFRDCVQTQVVHCESGEREKADGPLTWPVCPFYDMFVN